MNSVAHPTFSRLRAIEYGGRWNPPHGNTCAKPAPQNSQAGPVRRTGSKPLPGRSSVLGHEHRTARCPGTRDGRTVISVVAYLPGQMEALPRRRPSQTETGLARFSLIDEWASAQAANYVLAETTGA